MATEEVCVICDNDFILHLGDNDRTLCPGFRNTPITLTKTGDELYNMSTEDLAKELELVKKDVSDLTIYCENVDAEKNKLADIADKKYRLLEHTVEEYYLDIEYEINQREQKKNESWKKLEQYAMDKGIKPEEVLQQAGLV